MYKCVTAKISFQENNKFYNLKKERGRRFPELSLNKQ